MTSTNKRKIESNMKKTSLLLAFFTTLLLGACSNNQNKIHAIKHGEKTEKIKNSTKKKEHKSSENKKSSSTDSSSSSDSQSSYSATQSSQSQTTDSQPQSKSQGQINMERGYDPKGNPLLPGQDHAAGSDVYGNADDWVRGQEEWLQEQQSAGYIDANGSLTEKGQSEKAARDSAEFPDDTDDSQDYNQDY